MEPSGKGRSSHMLLWILVAVLIASLAFAFVTFSGPPQSSEEVLGRDAGKYLFSLGHDLSPTGRITGVIGLVVHLENDELVVVGMTPKLYIGGRFFSLKDGPKDLTIGDLNELGIPVSASNPFIIVELRVEPWYSPGSKDSQAVGGYVTITSVEKVWDLNLTSVVNGLIADFRKRENAHQSKISLANGALDQKAYNTHRTTVAASFNEGRPLVVFDKAAFYEGPLEWYIRPVHLMVASYRISPAGRTMRVTVAPPQVASVSSDGLRLTVLLAKGELVTGEEVVFRVVITNAGKQTYKVQAGLPFFDLNLYDGKGNLLGSWSSGKGFPEYVETIELAPGESRREILQWSPSAYDPQSATISQVPSGIYEITAVWVPEKLETPKIEVEMDSTRPNLTLFWTRTGGFAGFNQRLDLTADGEANLEDVNTGKTASLMLTPAEHWELYETLIEQRITEIQPEEYAPKGGAADFFTYEISVSMDGVEKRIKWVDAWAAEVALPPSLQNLDSTMTNLAQAVGATKNWSE